MKKKKSRINLYVDSDILELARKFSYISQKSVSRLFNEFFHEKLHDIPKMDPNEWLYGRFPDEDFPDAEEFVKDYEAMQEDLKEAEFCRKHPNSERAKLRLAKIKKYIEEHDKELQQQMKDEEEFRKRWEEVFPDDK